jgi:hypothetical protein
VSATTAAGRTLDRQFIISLEVASTVELFGFPSGALNRFQVTDSGYFVGSPLCFHNFASGFSGKYGVNYSGLNTLRKKKAGEGYRRWSRFALSATALLLAISGSMQAQGILTVTPSRSVATSAGTGVLGYAETAARRQARS